jgi:glutamate/tyrosine decarboxylase-like PLP-dependent enzyme
MQLSLKNPTWAKFLKIIEHYLAQNLDPNTPVIQYADASTLQEKLSLKLSESACSEQELLAEIEKYFAYSQRTLHPLYNNQLNAGANFEALLAEIVTFLTNTTMSTFEASPAATLIEAKLIQELNQKIGFSQVDGLMVTGGSNANLLAIHVARNSRFPEVKERGHYGRGLCVFVSREAHYSHKKAMLLLGMGLENLICVDTDNEGRMDSADLEKKILQVIAEDKVPLMLCSTAGTTVLGAFDPIAKNNKICKKYGLWHHVDGAWGGAALFSKKHSPLLAGLNNVDSFALDAHKLLGTGLITSLFLTNKKDALLNANSAGGTHYLFHDYENADFDSGRKSLQCGRKADALKLWLTWKSLGHQGMEDYVDRQFAKQEAFTQMIKDHPRLKLVHTPEYLNVCFQVLPPDSSQDINQYNLDLRFRIVKSGKMMVNYSSFADGTIFFRQVFANQHTTLDHLKSQLDTILTMAP